METIVGGKSLGPRVFCDTFWLFIFCFCFFLRCGGAFVHLHFEVAHIRSWHTSDFPHIFSHLDSNAEGTGIRILFYGEISLFLLPSKRMIQVNKILRETNGIHAQSPIDTSRSQKLPSSLLTTHDGNVEEMSYKHSQCYTSYTFHDGVRCPFRNFLQCSMGRFHVLSSKSNTMKMNSFVILLPFVF